MRTFWQVVFLMAAVLIVNVIDYDCTVVLLNLMSMLLLISS